MTKVISGIGTIALVGTFVALAVPAYIISVIGNPVLAFWKSFRSHLANR